MKRGSNRICHPGEINLADEAGVADQAIVDDSLREFEKRDQGSMAAKTIRA